MEPIARRMENKKKGKNQLSANFLACNGPKMPMFRRKEVHGVTRK